MYEKLRKLRKKKNLPITDIIKKLGFNSISNYYKKEAGDIDFSVEEAKVLSKMFDVTVEKLFEKEADDDEQNDEQVANF